TQDLRTLGGGVLINHRPGIHQQTRRRRAARNCATKNLQNFHANLYVTEELVEEPVMSTDTPSHLLHLLIIISDSSGKVMDTFSS
ncbi:hypothetical protein PGIGA_G00156920, partial [Pangasianodon gigas]|nr:hypothetical protein [Pangasianodon gigas]